MFHKTNGISPVRQDFIWLAEYLNGTHLAEFDFATHEEHSFYDIDRESLLRFGLVGNNMILYFYTDGIFHLNGHTIEVFYRTKEKDYILTGYYGKCRDIITYKDAESSFLANGGVTRPHINQYNFGYKTTIAHEDVTFNFKAICSIPFNQPAYMTFRLVADKQIDGKLVIKRNNLEMIEIPAPLSEGVGGEVNWIIK